jgi:DNA polymerase III epsilon subunit-like protein
MKLDNYTLYFLDCETTSLNPETGSIIELSVRRITDEFKTLFMRSDPECIEPGALRANGYKLEDILGQTKEGRIKFIDPKIALVELESFLLDDGMTSDQRILVGQNIGFDINFLKAFYKKHSDISAYPFSRFSIDTMCLAFVLDLVAENIQDGYSLFHLCKRFGIKNENAHNAESDVKSTKELFLKQIDSLKKLVPIKEKTEEVVKPKRKKKSGQD